MIWQIKRRTINLQRPSLMGILNLTPDSFSDGGKWTDCEKAFERAVQMAEEGADFLDLGGESTRPGAAAVSASEELNRILPSLKRIRRELDIPISIDTTKPEVAKICLEEGADIINDVSGLNDSGREMADLIRQHQAGLILMHRRGHPADMQSLAHYDDVRSDVADELESSYQSALKWGLDENQIVLDPGLGFAKTTEHNLQILKSLDRFFSLGRPLLLGPSRKSFIGDITGRPTAERGYGTAAVAAWAVLKGVQILRVHDVKAARDVAVMIEAITGDCHVRSL